MTDDELAQCADRDLRDYITLRTRERTQAVIDAADAMYLFLEDYEFGGNERVERLLLAYRDEREALED